ncbi:transglycosylase SLT domain-containing protein [Marinicella sp. W31]|uniref:transglycosylase SLT domain-containing protein n=1 Tax=Marinicella sp. W31 TaxID=3023713 RepID=UPI003756CB29
MKRLFLILSIVLFSAGTQAAGVESQRKLFKKLYYAALNGNAALVNQQRGPLKNYVLDHYLDYALIVAKIGSLPERAIETFRKQNPNSLLGKRLQDKLIDQLGRQKKWKRYLNYYSGSGKGRRQCWYLRARIATKQTQDLAPLVQAMWLSGLSAPGACDPAFAWWEKQGHLSDELVKKRFRLAFEENNSSLARNLKKRLSAPPVWMDYALDLATDPMDTLKQTSKWPATPVTREFIEKTAARMARKQPADLFAIWPDLKKHFSLKGHTTDRIEREMALFAATDYETFSITAMQQLPPAMKDGQIKAWIVRYHLFHRDWANVLKGLQDMGAEQLNQDRWQYWLGRSYAKNGQLEDARSTFLKLQKKSNYYGFLAADHMRMDYSICQKDSPPVSGFQYPDAIERAIELHHAGLLYMARREWNTAYKGLTRVQKLALADDLQTQGWYSKVIGIMADLGEWKNYEKRYPIAHEQNIKRHVGNYNIMPQWVMAIIKQESAWINDAVSHADAHGLMQIIPPTAKRLSQQLGLSYKDTRQLHQPDFNLRLGIHYQNNLFKRFDHPLLVAAAYNAGERKSVDWSSQFPSSPDMWLETIPYRETRDYITKILSNVTIYDWRMNQKPRRISSWMPTMPIDGQTPRAWPSANLSQQSAGTVCGP